MRLVTFHGADGLRLGVETDAGVVDVTEAAGDGSPASIRSVAAAGPEGLERLRQAASSGSGAVPAISSGSPRRFRTPARSSVSG